MEQGTVGVGRVWKTRRLFRNFILGVGTSVNGQKRGANVEPLAAKDRNTMKLGVIFLIVALASCASAPSEQVDGPATQQQRSAVLGDTVRLALGSSVRIAPSGPTIRFERVVSDSRCPPDVVCVWAGSVRVRLAMADGAGTTASVELESNTPPRTAEIGAYRIELLREVEPGPRASAPYVIRIVVTSIS